LNTEKEILDVVYCLDENYNLQMITSVNSFLQNFKTPVRLHILHNNPDSLDRLLKLLSFENLITIKKYKFIKNKNFIFPAIVNYHVTEATYYRLFLHEYLPKNISKLLYLDPDVIAINDISEKVQKQFDELKNSNFSIACVNYAISNNVENQLMLNELGMKSKKYFNAGVLFIDYKKWQSLDIGQSLLSKSEIMISNNIELKQHDQDILNSYFDGNFLGIDNVFNYPILERHYKKDKIKIEKNALFIHYVGKEKPWLLNGVFSKISKYYQNSFLKFNKGIHIELDSSVNLKNIFKQYNLRNLFNQSKITILLKVLWKYLNKR